MTKVHEKLGATGMAIAVAAGVRSVAEKLNVPITEVQKVFAIGYSKSIAQQLDLSLRELAEGADVEDHPYLKEELSTEE